MARITVQGQNPSSALPVCDAASQNESGVGAVGANYICQGEIKKGSVLIFRQTAGIECPNVSRPLARVFVPGACRHLNYVYAYVAFVVCYAR